MYFQNINHVLQKDKSCTLVEQIFTNEKLIIIQKVHYYSLLCNEKKFLLLLYTSHF